MQNPYNNPQQPRILEINVISAEDLRINGHPIKKNAVVYVSSDPCNEESTKINKDKGSNPSWNEKLDLKLFMHAKNIRVRVLCEKKLVGSATIPTSDFMEGYAPPYCLHTLSYRLKDRRGLGCGIINLSVRVKS